MDAAGQRSARIDSGGLLAIPVYVINLDRRPDRRRQVSADVDRMGLPPTRIPGVDGWLLTDDPALRLMRPGHVGCARSHYRAFEALLASEEPAALILEADAEIGPSVPGILRSQEWWPPGHGIVKWESTLKPRERPVLGRPVGRTPCGPARRPIVRKHLGGNGYLIDRWTVRVVLDTAPVVPAPIDVMLFNTVDSDGGSRRESCRRHLHGTVAPLGKLIALDAERNVPPITLDWDQLVAPDIKGRARVFQSLVGSGEDIAEAAASVLRATEDDCHAANAWSFGKSAHASAPRWRGRPRGRRDFRAGHAADAWPGGGLVRRARGSNSRRLYQG